MKWVKQFIVFLSIFVLSGNCDNNTNKAEKEKISKVTVFALDNDGNPVVATATGNTSTATGNTSTATGNTSTATGNTSTATGNTSTATGNTSTATGNNPIPQVAKTTVYTNKQNTIFYTPKAGKYTVRLSNGNVQVIEANGNYLYKFPASIQDIQLDGISLELKLLPKAIVEIKVIPSAKFPNNDVAIFCGTTNGLDVEDCEKSPLTKKLIEYALDKAGNVHLFRYNLGAGILEKADIYEQLIDDNPNVFQVKYEFAVSFSQGTQVANVLTERGKLSFKKHLKVSAPDNSILPEIQKLGLSVKNFLFLLSEEYLDFLDGSAFYQRAGNGCSSFRTRTDIFTLKLNTANTKTDFLMSNASHEYCANPLTTWTFTSMQTSHFNMGHEDTYLYASIVAILEGLATKKDLYDPRDTGALNLLTQLQNSSGIFTSLAVAPDGRTFLANVTTNDGTMIGTLTLGDINEGGKVFIGGVEIGTITFNGTTAVFTPKIVSIGSTTMTYDPNTNQFLSTLNGNTLSIDLNTGKIVLNGNTVSSFTIAGSFEVTPVSLPDIIAGNIKITNVKFDLSSMSVQGFYESKLGKVPVTINLKDNSVYLDGAYFASFSSFLNNELKSVEQRIMSQVPQTWKPYIDTMKNMQFNYMTVSPDRKILISLTYRLDSINAIDFIFELGIINAKPYLKTIPGTSFISLYPDANTSIFFSIDEFSLMGGEEPEGKLRLSTALKYKTSGKIKDIEVEIDGKKVKLSAGKLINTAAIMFLMNPDLAISKIAEFASTQKITFNPESFDLFQLLNSPVFFAPLLGYVFSSDEIRYELSANLAGSLALEYKNHILSMPRSNFNADGKGNIMTKIFFDLIPFITVEGKGNAEVSLESPDLAKSITIHAKMDAVVDAKLLFLSVVGAKAELETLDATVYFNRSDTQSKGNIYASVHVLANTLGFITITDQKLKVNLEHLNKDNYKMWLWRDRFDGLSSATQTGDIYFSAANGNVVIQSHNVSMSGRANVSNNCDGGLVDISGGNSIYIHQKTIACYSEGVIDIGCGHWQVWKTKWFDTSMDALDVRF